MKSLKAKDLRMPDHKYWRWSSQGILNWRSKYLFPDGRQNISTGNNHSYLAEILKSHRLGAVFERLVVFPFQKRFQSFSRQQAKEWQPKYASSWYNQLALCSLNTTLKLLDEWKTRDCPSLYNLETQSLCLSPILNLMVNVPTYYPEQ